MKKIIIIVISIIILSGLFLLGYFYFNQENVLKAQVINIKDNVLTVKGLDKNDSITYTFSINNNTEIMVLDKKINLNDFKEISQNFFNNKVIIEITYKGNIRETSPAQITNVKKIKLDIKPSIIVYLKKDTSPNEANDLKDQINNLDNVLSTVYKTKEEWIQEMKEYSDTFEIVLDYLDENPLLDSITVNVSDIKYIDEIVLAIKKMPNVEKINY